jgi:hypothetical protein
MRRRSLVGLIVGVLVALGIATMAWAYFTSTGSGPGAAATATLNPPTSVNAGPAGATTVPVSWTASSTGGGAVAPQGYYVTRTPSPSGASVAACGSSPTALLPQTPTSCSDTSVPGGTYTYTVTAVYNSFSATSNPSAPVTVASIAPSASAPGVSAPVNYGTSPYWVKNENVTLGDTPTTNGGSPIASVAYYYCSTSVTPCTSGNWIPIASTSAGGGWTVTWASASLPTDGTYDVVAVATNASSLTSATSSATAVGIDTTPPTNLTPSVNGYQ